MPRRRKSQEISRKEEMKLIHQAGKEASAQCIKDLEKTTLEGLGIDLCNVGPKDGLSAKECRRLRRILDEVEKDERWAFGRR